MADHARRGTTPQQSLSGSLTWAQAGATLCLSDNGTLGDTDHVVEATAAEARALLSASSDFGSPNDTQFESVERLEEGLGRALKAITEPTPLVWVGYWLMSLFLRGVNQSEATILTSFLMRGSKPFEIAENRLRKTVRRYPTGGISEKQALILPAFIHAASVELKVCSPFLVARRLGHTGGTRDKLESLPGIHFPTVREFGDWNPVTTPVRYFSANSEFCPRDEALYRLRGETGTIADFGLMASSILAKQILFPAELIILDVLYGRASFLKTKADAEFFGSLCEEISSAFGIAVDIKYRVGDSSLGSCIGNVLELYEVAKILLPTTSSQNNSDALDPELDVALSFMSAISNYSGNSSGSILHLCEDWLRDGRIFESMLQVWGDHGVRKEFIDQVRQDPRNAFLGALSSITIKGEREAHIQSIDSVAIADVVNNQINAYRLSEAGQITGMRKGGAELHVRVGEKIGAGTNIVTLYGDHPINDAVQQNIANAFEFS